MNRAEVRIMNYQNSNSQFNPMKNMCTRNSGVYLFEKYSKVIRDEMNFVRKLGRKRKRK